jgi:hypothetical protein
MANRPEIKIYPVESFPALLGENALGSQTAHDYSRQERNGRSPEEDRYLRGLIGKSVTVHTASTGQLQGVIEAVLPDAIIIRTRRGQILIHDWAIAAIEA